MSSLNFIAPLLALALTLLAGCGIRKDIHQAALDSIAEGQDRVAACQTELVASQSEGQRLHGVIQQCRDEVAAIGRARDEVLADNQALRAQLKGLGQDVDKLLAEKSTLAATVEDMKRALERARELEAAAAARDAMFRQLKDRLRKMIDAGTLSVRVARGRLVIDLKQDILFPSGSADVSDLGRETLLEVGRVLGEFSDRTFQIEGHTDNVPIKTQRFPSNWELSTARAVSVVKIFAEAGLSTDHLSAAGFGEFQPRADNGSPEGRSLNRRIEVVLVPDLQLLPDLVEGLAPGGTQP